MTRRRLSPYLSARNLGLTVLAIVLIAAMTAMGLWQLGVYRQSQALDAAEAARADPVPLDTLLRPDQAFTAEAHGRPVTVEGEYGGRQVLVDRGPEPPWLVTPLVTAAGAAVLVVRGVAPADTNGPATGAAATVHPPPPGEVRVTGSLQPSQARGGLDDDPTDRRVPSLNTAQLISEFDHDLYSGFVVLTDQQPPSTLPAATPPQPEASVTAGLRNLMYGLQWWLFGGFVVFAWWRIVREDARVA